ncbi:hypothetical protein IDAT_06160 [Pseudidiomarina atlantica]|jgi:hypothetical protein|uniref:Signal protein PDZ n=1 Tax=Pseudidiomarina atlantica TaxID=1517416 RepID=A0A094IM66_9GAMM|nr:aspartyl protease family protein [Pseudidiomarina atlantica]KFZ28785.1 hypothetical protein IDAT_06160 [Pseudidiomarina atlantica]
MRYIFSLIFLVFSQVSFAQATDWIDFEQSNGHIRIPVTVAGIDTYAIFDSGSQVNAINLAFMEAHDLEFKANRKLDIQGVNGIKERKVYREIPTNLIGMDLSMEMVGIDLGSPESGILLGAPVLNQFVLQFDYPNSRMRFAAHGTFSLRDVQNLEMRSQRGSGVPVVRVNLNDEMERWMLLDTGSTTGLFIDRIIATSNGWLDKYQVVEGTITGVNEIATVDYFRLPNLGIGPYGLADVLVTVPSEDGGVDFGNRYSEIGSLNKGIRISGILGYDVLKHFILTLDYKNGRGHIWAP